ncbi:unnamed protein product [Clonostachys rosea]|uniref:SET domain-containing protein n=1 Tax=Bionectria ochroleuca TaxID=29856 RepID=A0ABY6TN49_BIOOC|nr:unnamed protein product [Clonostachys rosea]
MQDEGHLENEAILRVAETGTIRGLGVFAKANVPQGHRVIFERPVMSCAAATLTNASLYYEWTRLGVEGQNRLKRLFWKLRLLPSSENPGFYTMRRLKSFVREHAYLQKSDPKKANIYKWCSYLNHACAKCANADYTVDSYSGAIAVTTTKPVQAGEEVIVNYNRGKQNLHCTACKPPSTFRRNWTLLRYRFLRWSARRAWPAGGEEPTLFPLEYDPMVVPTPEVKSAVVGQLDNSGSTSTISLETPRESGPILARLRGVYLSVLAFFHKRQLSAGQDAKDIELESENDTADRRNQAQ